MLSMICNHPDIEEFIEIKLDTNRITKANMSIRVLNDFIQAVKEDKPYTLSFTREETGETIEKTVSAKEIFLKLCVCNYRMAEPGILFWDRISNYNLMQGVEGFEYEGVNPCNLLCMA